MEGGRREASPAERREVCAARGGGGPGRGVALAHWGLEQL